MTVSKKDSRDTVEKAAAERWADVAVVGKRVRPYNYLLYCRHLP